jgi:hypothetical protein
MSEISLLFIASITGIVSSILIEAAKRFIFMKKINRNNHDLLMIKKLKDEFPLDSLYIYAMNTQPFFSTFEKSLIHSILNLRERLASPDIYFSNESLKEKKSELINLLDTFHSEASRQIIPAGTGMFMVIGFDERNDSKESRKSFNEKCEALDKQLINIRSKYIELIQWEINLL